MDVSGVAVTLISLAAFVLWVWLVVIFIRFGRWGVKAFKIYVGQYEAQRRQTMASLGARRPDPRPSNVTIRRDPPSDHGMIP